MKHRTRPGSALPLVAGRTNRCAVRAPAAGGVIEHSVLAMPRPWIRLARNLIVTAAILLFLFWWVTAPKIRRIPGEIVASIPACVDLEEFDENRNMITWSELDARTAMVNECVEEKRKYWEASGSTTSILQPPMVLEGY